MKSKILLIFFASLTILSSCFLGKKNKTTNTTTTAKEYTGSYVRKTGVMNNISCYCFKVGNFTTEAEETIVICFDKIDDEPTCSENLHIKGSFESVTIQPEDTSPCPAGTMEVFMVSEFECR